MPLVSSLRVGCKSAVSLVRGGVVLIVALCSLAGCTLESLSAPPQQLGKGEGVLFIGNSLTSANDLPGILEALADSAHGQRIPTTTVAYGGFALGDHWVTGESQSQIAR